MVTLCAAIGAGLFLTALSRRLQLPTIVLLLAGGLVLGPEVLGWIDPADLGDLFPVIVSLAVGIILFEGGLTLDLREFAHSSKMIQRLLTLGVLITWLGTGALIWGLFGLTPSYALLAASLVVVTGPTVIVPLLKRIKVTTRLSTILHWEGVLIDAIGVFLALLCFEWVIVGAGGQAVANFGLRVVLGLGFGFAGGWLIQEIIRRRLIPENLVNAFTLASGIFVFGLTEAFISEAGLLAVTVSGLVIGWKPPVELKEIRAFKAEITDLLIGLLFILLVSRLEIQQFIDFGIKGAVLVGLLMILIRPLNVFTCAVGTGLSWKERHFLSWVAPRGIVAASMASLFALSLESQGPEQQSAAIFIETFTYSVICATVILQGLSAGLVAKFLGLKRPDPVGWLIVSAHAFSRQLAEVIKQETEKPVILIDSNAKNVQRANELGLDAYHEDAMDADALVLRERFQTIGNLIALTDNTELNQLLGRQWQSHLGRYNTFAWRPATPAQLNKPGRGGAATSTTMEHIGSIFEDIARPTIVSGELERLESSIEVVTIPETETEAPPGIPGHPLLIFTPSAVIPIANDADISKYLKPGHRIATLHRSRGFLRRALASGAFVQLEAQDLESLYRSLVERAALLVPQLSIKETMDDLYAQQKAFPSFLGQGVAVPHIHASQLPERICIFAKLDKPLPFLGKDEQIRILFFIISPTGDSEGHLATLAEIARTCKQQENLAALEAAETLNDVLRLV